jgi:hypothetical protein
MHYAATYQIWKSSPATSSIPRANGLPTQNHCCHPSYQIIMEHKNGFEKDH